MWPVIRTGVLGYVLISEGNTGIVAEYGDFPSSADSEYLYSELGQYPYNGFIFGKDAPVKFDVSQDPWGGVYAVNLQPQ